MSRPFTNNEPEDFLRGLSTRVNRLERQRSGTPRVLTQAVTDIHSARLASALPVETPAVLVGGQEPPTSLLEGTIWRDTSFQPSIDRILTPDGWEKIEDPVLLEAIAPFDSSVEILSDPTMPTGDDFLYGSLWRDPVTGRLYRWDGTQWRDVTVGDTGAIDQAQDWIADTGTELETNLAQAQTDIAQAEADLALAQDALDIAFPDGPFDVGGVIDQTVTDSVVEYAVNTSETVPPTAGWSTATPVRGPEESVWFRTVVTYGDNTTNTSSPALLQGPSSAGEPGVGIASTEITYQIGTSGTTAPTGTWLTTVPATSPGEFLWTRNLTTYTDDSTSTAYSVAAHGTPGADGDDGNDGVGVSGTEVRYQTGASATTAPTGAWSTTPTATTTGQFLWTRTIITYTDASTSTAYSVAAHGAEGEDGADGVGVSDTEVEYQIGTSGTAAPGGAWSTTVPATTAGQFLWTRTITTFTDASTSTAYSVAAHGTPGADGDDGNDGVGVSETEVRYQVGSSATSAPTGTWSTTPTATTTGKYQWTRTVTTYTDGSTSTAYSVAAHGTPGADGNDGVGVSGTEVKYQIGSSGTTEPTGTWLTTVPATATGQFLWTRTVTTYTDASTSTAYSVSAHGTPGADGDDGNDGVGVQGTAVTYQVSSSGTSTPGGTWVTAVPSTSPGQYLWTRTIITYTDASTTTMYSVAKHGTTGSPGVSVVSITPYFRLGTTTPAKPTTNPPPDPWQTTEPAWVEGQMMYRTERIVYSSGSPNFAYTDVSLVAAFQAADAAMAAANGKNTMTYTNVLEADKPGPDVSGVAIGRIPGDVHRNRNATTGVVYAEFVVNDSGNWQKAFFGNEILTSLDVGKLSAGTADIETAVVNKMAVQIADIIDLDVERLTVTDLSTMDEAVINKLWTDVVRSRKITTDMLIVGPGDNLIPNPNFEEGAWGWEVVANVSYEVGAGVGGSNAMKIATAGTTVGAYFGEGNPEILPTVEPDKTYRLNFYARSADAIPVGRSRIYVSWQDASGTPIGSLAYIQNTASIPANVDTRVEGMLTAPVGAVKAKIGLFRMSIHSADIFYSLPTMVSATDASLIVDGSILAQHVDAESVAAALGEFVYVEAEHILAGSINVALSLGVSGSIQVGEDDEVHIIIANNEIAIHEPNILPPDGGAEVPGSKFISLGGIRSTDPAGPVVTAYNLDDNSELGGLRRDGSLFGTRLDVDEINVGGVPLVEVVGSQFIQRGYGYSSVVHSGITTKAGVFAVFCPGLFRAGFQYRIQVSLAMRADNGWCDVSMRERSDSLPPSITLGTQIGDTQLFQGGGYSDTIYETSTHTFIWRPTTTDRKDVTFLLCLAPSPSAVVAGRRYEMTVIEEGVALPDTGYDAYVTPPTKQFVETFYFTDHQPFTDYGPVGPDWNPYYVKTGVGGSSEYRTFLPLTTDMRNTLNAATTVDKIEIYLRQAGGYYNATPRIGVSSATSYSASTLITYERNAPNAFSPGDGKWMTLDSTLRNYLAGSSGRAFVAGSRTTGPFMDFYGTSSGTMSARPKMRITSWRP